MVHETLSVDPEQFHFEYQRCVRWDGVSCTPGAVSQGRWNGQPALATDLITTLAGGGSLDGTKADVANLQLGASQGIAIAKNGANAADFTVSALSGTTVPATGGSVTFTVTFTPTASGAGNAALHIASNVTGAKTIGALAAKIALDKGIKQVVFDRSGARYHGKVKALADAAREAGLQF